MATNQVCVCMYQAICHYTHIQASVMTHILTVTICYQEHLSLEYMYARVSLCWPLQQHASSELVLHAMITALQVIWTGCAKMAV